MPAVSFLQQLKSIPRVLTMRQVGGRAGSVDSDASTFWTTPWAWRDEQGLYIGWNKEAWLYWQLPINPLLWEDPSQRLEVGSSLVGLLAELGDLNVDNSMGLAILSNARQVHVVSVSWEEPGRPAPDVAPDLADFQSACLDFLIPHKALFVGVRLRSESALAAVKYKGFKGLLEQAKDLGSRTLGEEVPSRELFDADREKVERIFRRHGAFAPTQAAATQLEAWYNQGRTPDVLVQVADESLYVADFDQFEFSAVMRFKEKTMVAPHSQWVLDAVTHPSGPKVVSIRGELQAPSIARSRARQAQRRIRAQIEEEMATGDIERMEDTIAFEQAQ